MADAETSAQDGTPDLDPVAQVTAPEGTKANISVHDAARVMAQARNAARQQAQSVSQESAPAPAAAPEPESAPEADAAPPQEATGETEESDPAPQEEPPLDLPRSWTRDQADHWNRLDRSTQEFLLESDRKASDAVRRSQNEAAEQKKTLEAERTKLEQARTQYEQALPALVESLQHSIAGDFPDIKTMEDVQNLARTDWARYIAWDASQKKLAAVASEARAAQERQVNDAQTKFANFAKEQDKLFIDKAPEFADSAKAAALQRNAVNLLKDIGFTDDELQRKWAGQEDLSLRDHRFQLLVRDAARYREAQATAKKAVPKSVPPVQRPGVAQPASVPVHAQIAAVQKELSRTTSPMAAAELGRKLLNLQRAAAGR